MWIYLTLLIPLIIIVVLKLLFGQEIKWKEAIICVLVAALVMLSFRFIALWLLPKDREFLNGYITQARYYEDWNELVTHYYTTGKTTSVYYTVDVHPEYWLADTNCFGVISISKQQYDKYVSMWNNKKFQELNRNYYSKDGNEYYSDYDNKFENIIPLTKINYYENRITHSKNVFNYEQLNSQEVSQVYKYPDLNIFDLSNNFQYLIGINDNKANHLLASWNAKLGAIKRVAIFLLIYPNKLQDVSFLQERYWQGGNKNELVVCVGIDSKNNITWSRVFSWTTSEGLKPSLSSSIMSMKKFDDIKIINLIGELTNKLWVKRDFREFNYITVDVPTWVNVIIVLLSFTTCGVLLYFAYCEDW
jgi:hypothetical protein